MATIHHQPYHHSTTTATSSSHRPRRHSLDYSSLSTLKHSPTSTFSSHLTTLSASVSASASASASVSTTTTTPTSPPSTSPFSLDVLERCLAEENFRQADEETRRLLIVLAGEQAIKRGYVFFSEVQFIPKEELKAIDNLWMKYSNNRFGYSVQKKIWVKVDMDFTKFFMKVGWMKKLDTEIEQFNYRSFPSEFIWELNPNKNDESSSSSSSSNIDSLPPEGHLPLTNALRGTRLLAMIFNHPAFDEGDDEERRNNEENDVGEEVVIQEVGKKKSRLANLRDRLFKPNYTF